MRRLRLAAADGFPLDVQLGGPVDAPPLLLLQGQANSHLWWERTRGAFEDRFQTITFDYRGTGGSRRTVGSWSGADLAIEGSAASRTGAGVGLIPWTTAGFAADAAHILDSLGIPSAAVYGTSMGGRIAQFLAADHPPLADVLILACTSPGGPHAVQSTPAVRRSLADPDPHRRRRTLAELFYTPAWPHDPETSTLLGDPSMTPTEAAAHLHASTHHNAWDRLPAIQAPTLIIHGSDDLMTPAANAELLAARIPGAELVIHAGGRHGFFEEFADEVVPLVRRFLGVGGAA